MFLPKLSDTDTCIWKQETVKRGNQYKGDQGKPESTCMHAGIVLDHSIKTAKRCKVIAYCIKDIVICKNTKDTESNQQRFHKVPDKCDEQLTA